MYFDLRVKRDLDEFYNYREELHSLMNRVSKDKLIVVKGLRRVGKTSLMSVCYNLLDQPKTFLDARDFRNAHDLMNKAFLEIYSQIDPTKKIFEMIDTLDIGPFSLRLDKSKITLDEIENKLKNRRAVIFIDEVQELDDIDKLIAHAYDHTSKIVFVISGSEVGLLERIFYPDKPLFGRLKTEVILTPLDRDKSLEFLRLGFAQEGKEYNERELEEAVDELDGLIGWLTYYGYLRRTYSHKRSLDILKENARLLVMSELERFLSKKRSKRIRYLLILKGLKTPKTWSGVKEYLEFKLKEQISNARLSEYLKELVEHGFVVKQENRYSLADPLLKLLG